MSKEELKRITNTPEREYLADVLIDAEPTDEHMNQLVADFDAKFKTWPWWMQIDCFIKREMIAIPFLFDTQAEYDEVRDAMPEMLKSGVLTIRRVALRGHEFKSDLMFSTDAVAYVQFSTGEMLDQEGEV